MAAKTLPDLDTLRRYFTYDAETGAIRWKHLERSDFSNVHRWQKWGDLMGKDAGTLTRQGYWMVAISRRRIFAHRIAYFMHHGVEAVGEVDHINGDRADNRACNLRDTSVSQNRRNVPSHTDAASKFIGVARARNSRWRAYCSDQSGRFVSLGQYATEEEAARARDRYAHAQFGEYVRLNLPL